MTTLLRCYLPVFQLGIAFSLAPESEPSFASFRQKVDRALELALAKAVESEEERRSAHFAVVVWLDELVLLTAPVWVAEWRASLLQIRLFHTSTGGEAFFSRLEALGREQIRLRQVYLFCLLMGFKGKYAGQDSALLAQRIASERASLEDHCNAENLNAVSPGQKRIAAKNKTKWLNQPGRLTAIVLATYLFMMVSGLYLANGN